MQFAATYQTFSKTLIAIVGLFVTCNCFAQEDWRGDIDCPRWIDVKGQHFSTGNSVRVTALSICVFDNQKSAVHFIVSSMHGNSSYPRYENAPWLKMAFKDNYGNTVWEGNVALATVGTCGGYQTHYVPGPMIDWTKVKLAFPSLGGTKASKCGGSKGIEKLGEEIMKQCKKHYNVDTDDECIEKGIGSYTASSG